MNFLDLQTELGRRIQEALDTPGQWTTAERQLALNLAQLDLVKEYRLLVQLATATPVVGQQDYTLTTSFSITAGRFAGMIELRYTDGSSNKDVKVLPATLRSLYDLHPTWRYDSNADPPKFFFDPDGGAAINLTIGLYPKPATTPASGLRLSYVRRPADMTGNTDEPFNITAGTTRQYPALEVYDSALVWRAAWRLLQDDTTGLADRFLALYHAEIGRARRDIIEITRHGRVLTDEERVRVDQYLAPKQAS